MVECNLVGRVRRFNAGLEGRINPRATDVRVAKVTAPRNQRMITKDTRNTARK